MNDHTSHIDAARAYLRRLPDRLSPETLVSAARVEAYLAIAAAIADRREEPADGSRPGR